MLYNFLNIIYIQYNVLKIYPFNIHTFHNYIHNHNATKPHGHEKNYGLIKCILIFKKKIEFNHHFEDVKKTLE
jgi:hypothetical protein